MRERTPPLPADSPPMMGGHTEAQQKLRNIVSNHILARQPTPATPEMVTETEKAILLGRLQMPYRVRLSYFSEGEYGLGAEARRYDRKDVPTHALRVNAELFGAELWALEALANLHKRESTEKGFPRTAPWVDITHPLVSAVIEHARHVPGFIDVGDPMKNQWRQHSGSVVNMLVGQVFQEEMMAMHAADPTLKPGETDYMPMFRQHLAGVMASEIADSGQIDYLLVEKRQGVAERVNALLEQAGMDGPFAPSPEMPFRTPVSDATQMVVGMLWGLATLKEADLWPADEDLYVQHGGENTAGNRRGPWIVAQMVYPTLATEDLRKRYDALPKPGARLLAQVRRSLMHHGVAQGDQFWDERLAGALAALRVGQDPTGATQALIDAGKLLKGAFTDLETAVLNLRVRPDIPTFTPQATPLLDVRRTPKFHSAHNFKEVEAMGATSFSLDYAEPNFVDVVTAGVGAGPDGPMGTNTEIPWMEITGTLDDSDTVLVQAKIRGIRDRSLGHAPGGLLKAHHMQFAAALEELAVNQGRDKFRVVEGMDSRFLRKYKRLKDPARVASFAQIIAAGGTAVLSSPLVLPLKGKYDRPDLATVSAGEFMRDGDGPVSPDQVWIPLKRVAGKGFGLKNLRGEELRWGFALHYRGLMDGLYEGIEADAAGLMPVVSATAANSTMPTLRDGIEAEGAAELWAVDGDTVKVAHPPLPHMRVNGRRVDIKQGPPSVYTLMYSPVLGDTGRSEVYSTWNSAAAQRAASLLVAMHKQHLMFMRPPDRKAWDQAVGVLVNGTGEPRALGRRLWRATFHPQKEKA